MKHLFRSGSRWLRRAAGALPALSLLLWPATGHGAAPERDAAPATPAALSSPRGFIMDMAPLLGESGRLRAIAPGCRAVTGIVDGRPFIWSRDFGAVRLIPPSTHYGMGVALSDDGRIVTGFLRQREGAGPPPGYGQTLASPGFVWKYGREIHYMSRHDLIDVSWHGLSANGRVAVGKGMEPVPGAPAPDASGEELERFARTPQGRKAMSRGYIQNRPLWFHLNGSSYRELKDFRQQTPLLGRILSRDGKKIITFRTPNSFVRDLKTGRERQLTFGGAVAGGEPGKERNIIRAGDPDSPLYRWGRQRLMSDNRLLADAELAALQKKKNLDPKSPMLLDWFVHDIESCTPSFDARYNLCCIRLQPYRPDIRRNWPVLPGGFRLLARLDDKGGVTPIADDDDIAAGPLGVLWDISDNGRIVLYEQKREMYVWNEDIPPPGRHDNAWKLKDYLASFGLVIPSAREIREAIMSPDGRCFYGELASREDEQPFPRDRFLACTGEGIEPPHWTLKKDVTPARP